MTIYDKIQPLSEVSIEEESLPSRMLSSRATPSISETVVEEFDEVEEYIFDDCDFPFTNLCFEGGGNKGMAYVGSLEVIKKLSMHFMLHVTTVSFDSRNKHFRQFKSALR